MSPSDAAIRYGMWDAKKGIFITRHALHKEHCLLQSGCFLRHIKMQMQCDTPTLTDSQYVQQNQ